MLKQMESAQPSALYVAEIESNVNLQRIMITNLLDYTNFFCDEVKLERSEFTLEQVIEDCFGIFRSQMAFKNIQFKVSYQKISKAACLVNDQMKLLQILTNLVNNSLKFTNQGGSITVTFSEKNMTKLGQQKLNLVAVQVEDTGQGIKDEVLKQISQMNDRLADEESFQYKKGTGNTPSPFLQTNGSDGPRTPPALPLHLLSGVSEILVSSHCSDSGVSIFF